MAAGISKAFMRVVMFAVQQVVALIYHYLSVIFENFTRSLVLCNGQAAECLGCREIEWRKKAGAEEYQK